MRVQAGEVAPRLQWRNDFLWAAAAIALVCGCGRSGPEPEDPQAVPVEVTVIAPGPVSETAVFTGILAGYRAVDVVSEAVGEIVSIRKDLGDRVEAGEVLAMVEKRVARENVNLAKAGIMAAEAAGEVARVDFGRDSTLFYEGTSSEAVFQRSRMALTAAEANLLSARASLELAERNLEETDIRSPFAGYVSRRDCELGSYVGPGLPVYRIVDIDSLRVRVGVSQAEVGRVGRGMKAQVTAEGLSNRVFEGRVRAVSPGADEVTRTFAADVVLANRPGLPLRDGMVVRVSLTLGRFEEALRIQREAVLRNGEGGYVFVVIDSTAHHRDLDLGALIDNQYLIAGGLTPGDRVVTVGMQNLRDGSRVSIETEHSGPGSE